MEETQIAPQVSVLIVSYNCAAALRRCLQSVEASADRDKMEVLVIDAGSIDGSAAVVADFSQVVLLTLPRNFGFVKALNIGMRTAKAEFYFYLSPHAEVLPDTIPALAARLSGQADAVAVCPLLRPAGHRPALCAVLGRCGTRNAGSPCEPQDFAVPRYPSYPPSDGP
jgi:GT2 family glycosyltransferase